MKTRQIMRAALVCTPFLLAGCTSLAPYTPPQPLLIDVTRDGEMWQATYTLPRDAPIWAMHRSGENVETGEPWRPDVWRITTPGVTLQRIGSHDALVAAKGTVPRQVTVEFDIADIDVRFNHDPAVVMSNGALALFTGQFTAFPMDDAGELEELVGVYPQSSELRFRDIGNQVIHNGAPADTAIFKVDGYVVYGQVNLLQDDDNDAVIDPGMPDWLAEEVTSFTQLAIAEYTQRIGQSTRGRPVLVASWLGPLPGITRTSGAAVGSTLSMNFGGEGFTRRNYPALVYAQRLIAHEAAHIWLGQILGASSRGDRWITEGGATLLAVRMQEALDSVNGSDAFDFELTQRLAQLAEEQEPYAIADYLARAREQCPAWLAQGSVATAHSRTEEDAFYDCGAVFALAVEQAGAHRGEDFFDFVALLIQRNPNGTIDLERWLSAAREFGLSQEKSDLIEELVETGSEDGEAAIAHLLSA